MSSWRVLPISWKCRLYPKHCTLSRIPAAATSTFNTNPTFLQSQCIPNTGTASVIGKRSFRNRGHDQRGEGSRFFDRGFKRFGLSKGTALLGAGIAYATFSDENKLSSFEDFTTAHCAKKDDDCCIEKKCEDSICLRKLDCEEELIRTANESLRKAILETKAKAVQHTEGAIKAYCEAIELMQQYLDQGYCVIKDDKMESPVYEETWCCLYEISRKRCEKVREAIVKGQCAWALLCRLREIVETGKECKYTSCNPLLPLAEEALLCAEEELIKLKKQMDEVGPNDTCIAKRFKEVLEEFKQDLQNEMQSLPEHLKCEILTCQQEKAMMINLAFQRSVSLQKGIAHSLLIKGKIPEKQQKTLC